MGDLGVGHEAADQQRGGGGGEARHPVDEHVQQPRAIERHQPVGGQVHEAGDDEEGGQLDEGLGEEVGLGLGLARPNPNPNTNPNPNPNPNPSLTRLRK